MNRIKILQKKLQIKGLTHLFVTNFTNIHYLTGFTGISETERESTFLVSKNEATLFAPKLYQEEALKLKNKDLDVVITSERDALFVAPVKNLRGNAGVEANDLRLGELKILKANSEAKFIETENLVEGLRLVKTREEIKIIKRAVEITDYGFEKIQKHLRPGLTEKDVAKRMQEIFENEGADSLAFDTIVASGTNSALPHYITGNTKLKPGILLIDAGARYKGYCGDLTRVFYLGNPDKTFRDRYNFVLEVQEKALKYLKPGVTGESLWKNTVDDFGAETKYFTHGLGHGVGLQIHEKPYLRKGRTDKIKAGMVITIEPGLYYPGWGGVRIEDYCLVTKNGCEELSKTPKVLASTICN